MSDEALETRYGRGSIEPDDDVIAGSWGTWQLTYRAGSLGIRPGGRIRISTDSDTDWALPQFRDPTGDDYCTIDAPEGVRITALAASYGNLVLTIGGRGLAPDEGITIRYGDTSGGGRGSRAQTFCEAQRFYHLTVSPEADAAPVRLPRSPHLRIVGGAPVSLHVVAPSTIGVGQPFRLLVRLQDAWGNRSSTFCGTVRLDAPSFVLPENTHTFTASDEGIWWIKGCCCASPGLFRVAARDDDGALASESNPVHCTESPPACPLYWGDFHGGQLHDPLKIAAFFRYGRDVSGIDFAGYQPNAHRISTEEWDIQQQAERDAYEPGRFVPLPGFEWTGEVRDGGHHNVFFKRHGQPIRRSCHMASIAGQDDHDTDLPHITDVHNAYRGSDTVITPHVGGGRADLRYHDPSLEPAIEVTSNHGTFEWFLRDALTRGYRMGFIGGSDGYTGRPGGEYPGHLERRFAKGGLAAVYAQTLTIDGLLEALKARHVYATTGARILLDIDADGHMLGDAYHTTKNPTIKAHIHGTAPLESVELFRGLACVYRHPLDCRRNQGLVRLTWQGASRRTSYSAVIWDGWLEIIDRADSAKGPIVSETIRFDSPRSFVQTTSPTRITWHAETCGHRSGFVFRAIEGDPLLRVVVNTTLTTMPAFGGFGDTNPKRMSYAPTDHITFEFHVSELGDGPLVVPIGPIDRKLVIEFAPEGGSPDAAFTHTDLNPQPGTSPYWLRIVQRDMEMAWTSPVFVDYAAGEPIPRTPGT